MSDETRLCDGKNGCGELRWIEEFRVLSHGSRASMCRDCERQYDHARRVTDPEVIPVGLMRWERAYEPDVAAAMLDREDEISRGLLEALAQVRRPRYRGGPRRQPGSR
jgi:hypothetical protein